MPGLNKNRKRNLTVAFKVTPEENELINLLSKTAGMTKQEYIISKLTDRAVVVKPDTRTYKSLRGEMGLIYSELCRIRDARSLRGDLIDKLNLITRMMAEMGAEETERPVETEDNMIAAMSRK